MKFLVCLLVSLSVAFGVITPINNCAFTFCTMDLKVCPDGTPAPVPAGECCPSLKACKPVNPITPINNCAFTFCTMDLKVCPDGTPAPVPAGECCPSLKACKPVNPITPITNCAFAFCTMDLKICPDGTPAPVPAGECCPSLKACKTGDIGRRSNPLASLLSGNNLLQTLSTATHGTDLGSVISILNLLNNVHQLSNDIHQIPLLINQTLAGILNGTGQAGQVIIDQVVGAIKPKADASRDLLSSLGSLGQSAGLLSSVTHLLPQGTSITTVLSILNLLNNVNQLSHDVHQIPALLNQTLAGLLGGAGQASQVVVQQLLNLGGNHNASGRDLLGSLGSLGQSAGLLSSITHLLPQGTSITTVLSILNLLNNVNQLSHDVHQIPILINQTLSSLVGGAGQASQVVVQQLLNLVGIQSQIGGRDLLGSLGQNANLLSTVSHLLPQGTSITTVLSLLNLLNNVNALNNDVHQIPAVLQQTLQTILSGIQNLIPPTLQPVQGSS
jgi:hypothetical protein